MFHLLIMFILNTKPKILSVVSEGSVICFILKELCGCSSLKCFARVSLADAAV